MIGFTNAAFGFGNDSTKVRVLIGAAGGLSQHRSFSGDVYGGVILPLKSKKVNANIGYTYFQNSTSYSQVNDLKFSSHGLFLEGNFYLMKGFYAGLKLSVNLNLVDKTSQQKFDIYPDTDSPTFFGGTAGYLNLGYHKSIVDKIGIKLQGQIGLHNYKISENWLLIDNTDDDFRDEEFGIESHAEFLYNFSIGFTYQL